MRSSVQRLGFSAVLLAGACSTQAPQPQTGGSYGLVTLVDGRVGVVDLATANINMTMRPSTRGVAQVAALPETHELFTGDPNQDQIIRYQFDGAMKSAKELARFESPVYVNGITADERPGAAHDRLVVTSRNALLWKIAVPTTSKPQDSIAIYDVNAGAWSGTLKLGSPWRAEVRDHTAYVANVHDRNIAVVDMDKMSVSRNLAVGPDLWPTRDGLAVGPVNVTTSKDGRWLISSDFEGLSLTVFDTQNDFAKKVYSLDGVVYTASLSADESQLYVVTYDLNMPLDQVMAEKREAGGNWYDGPQPLDEAHNATLHTHVHVFAWPSMQEVKSFVPEWAGQRAFFGSDPSKVYLTTSAGSILEYDTATLRLRGEAVVGGVGSPIYCGSLGLF